MQDNKEDEKGILIRILSNPDIQKGFAFFGLALILAFSAVVTTVEEDVDRDTIGPDDNGLVINIHYPRLREIDNASLEMKGDDDDESKATIKILNSTYDPISLPQEWTTGDSQSMNLTEVENKSLDLRLLEDTPRHFSFNVTEGNLTYTYTVSYPSKPYAILSLPAALLTLIGMVYAFKGKGVILGEIKRRQAEKEARKKKEERGKEKEEEDVEEESETSKDVIYEGTGAEKGGGEADHLDFMGVTDDSKDEEDEEKEE